MDVSLQQAAPPQTAPAVPWTRGLKASIPISQTVLYAIYTVIPSYLIPVQVQQITGKTDVAALGVALTAGGVAAGIGNPVIGMLSDRTRSRFGRRTPWLVGTVVAAAILLCLMANAATIALVGLAYAATWIALNGLQATLAAVVPDRVTAPEYNTYSGLMGVGLNLGVLIPSGLLALFPQLASQGAYYALAAFIVLSVVAFLLLSPDRPATDGLRTPFTIGSFLGSFWVSPRRAPDFPIVFGARALLMFGYWLVFSLFYFLLQDFVGLKPAEAIGAMGAIFFVNGLAALVGAWGSALVGRRTRRLKPTVVIAGLLLAISSAVPLIAPSVPTMIVWAIINGLGFGIYMSVDTALAIRVLPNVESAGKDLGVLNLAMMFPIVLSPGLGALLVTWFGYAGLLVAATVVALGGAFVVLRVRSVD